MMDRNAIRRVMDSRKYIAQFGKKWVDETIEKMDRAFMLDESKDAPLPEWAVQLLNYDDINYRARIKIVLLHHFDITQEKFKGHHGWLMERTVETSPAPPPMPAPPWMQDFRKRQSELAEEYIRKTKESENG